MRQRRLGLAVQGVSFGFHVLLQLLEVFATQHFQDVILIEIGAVDVASAEDVAHTMRA